jgi:ADP-ribose pyrophosphatase
LHAARRSRIRCQREQQRLRVRRAARPSTRGAIIDVEHNRYRYADGKEVGRDIVRHPGAVGIVCHDGQDLWLVKQPRQAVDDPDVLEIPGRQARRGG